MAMAWDPQVRAAIESLLASQAGLAVLFALSIVTSATLILPAPGLAITVAAGTVGDPLLVGAVAGVGQAIGELTGYAAGASGRSLVPQGPVADRVVAWIRRFGVPTVFVLAAIPNPAFDIAGVAAGASRMPLLAYLGSAAGGKVLKNIVIAGTVAIGT
jgi:membrane protein YqaA with SNARE-associated domain